MKIGDYVRTETGQIGKITYFEGDMARVDCNKFITYKSNHNEITKISPNIIDLIEVGDIIKWKTEHNSGINEVIDRFGKGVYAIEEDITIMLDELTIKSIVTKEQFESMEYKIGE